MINPRQPRIILAAVALTSLPLAGSAAAAAPLELTPALQKTTLSHARVERLLTHGERFRVSVERTGHYEVRMFVYQRTLNRGGDKHATEPGGWKSWISPLYHLDFTRPGTQWITLHVNNADHPFLLNAGNLTVGVSTLGY